MKGTEEKLGKTLAVRKRAGVFSTTLPLTSEKLKYSLSESNALVLDHAVCTVNGVKAEDEAFILDIDKALRQELGANPRSGHMVLTGRYHQFLPGLEAIYLMGVFGVANESTIIPIPETLADARNTVKVTVYGHRRNLCGSFYLKDKKWPT